MLKRLLKLLSGLTMSWVGRQRVPARPAPERASADYLACKCGTFPSRNSSRFTCRECTATRFRYGPRPVRASRIPGGVELSLPMSCPVSPGGKTPRIMARLQSHQAKAVSQVLLRPGSDGVEFDRDGSMLLAVSWLAAEAKARITVRTPGSGDADLSLTAAQAGRLGEDIAGRIGIIFTDASEAMHDQTRPERVSADYRACECGEFLDPGSSRFTCRRCSASAERNRDAENTTVENTPRAFIDYIMSSTFDRTSLRPWEVETLWPYLSEPKNLPCPNNDHHTLARAVLVNGHVQVYLLSGCGQTPQMTMRLKAGQAEALSQILLKPSSGGLGIRFDRNDMLTADWRGRVDTVRIIVHTTGNCDSVVDLDAAKAIRLGEDIVGCLSIAHAATLDERRGEELVRKIQSCGLDETGPKGHWYGPLRASDTCPRCGSTDIEDMSDFLEGEHNYCNSCKLVSAYL